MPNLRKYTTFRATMTDLIFWTRSGVKKRNFVDPSLVHHQVCEEISTRFKLWTGEGTYPKWLSRVVSGVVSDLAEGVEAD